MHQSMKDRGQQDPRYADEDQPGKEGVERGEELAAIGGDVSNRTHPPEQHRRIEKGVDPGEARRVVPNGADAERRHDDQTAHQKVTTEALPEMVAW